MGEQPWVKSGRFRRTACGRCSNSLEKLLVKAPVLDDELLPFFLVMNIPEQIFTDETLRALFPPERSHDFFDALFGDASEGAYDIVLSFERYDAGSQTLHFLLNLHERPGRCLACNLTYGLPEVFSRHPVINIKKLVSDIGQLLGEAVQCGDWQLGHTVQKSRSLHAIPLEIQVQTQ